MGTATLDQVGVRTTVAFTNVSRKKKKYLKKRCKPGFSPSTFAILECSCIIALLSDMDSHLWTPIDELPFMDSHSRAKLDVGSRRDVPVAVPFSPTLGSENTHHKGTLSCRRYPSYTSH